MKSFMEQEILTDDGAGQLSARLARGQGRAGLAEKSRGGSKLPPSVPDHLPSADSLVQCSQRGRTAVPDAVLRLDPPAFRAGYVVGIDRFNAGFLGMKSGHFNHGLPPLLSREFLNVV
jgi:hypothetical protein